MNERINYTAHHQKLKSVHNIATFMTFELVDQSCCESLFFYFDDVAIFNLFLHPIYHSRGMVILPIFMPICPFQWCLLTWVYALTLMTFDLHTQNFFRVTDLYPTVLLNFDRIFVNLIFVDKTKNPLI